MGVDSPCEVTVSPTEILESGCTKVGNSEFMTGEVSGDILVRSTSSCTTVASIEQRSKAARDIACTPFKAAEPMFELIGEAVDRSVSAVSGLQEHAANLRELFEGRCAPNEELIHETW